MSPKIQQADKVLAAAEEKGILTPALMEKFLGPELGEVEYSYWEAYQYLHSCRSYGMNGPNPLEFKEMFAYAADYQGYDYEGVTDFLAIVKAVDTAYLKDHYTKVEQKRKADEAKGKSRQGFKGGR